MNNLYKNQITSIEEHHSMSQEFLSEQYIYHEEPEIKRIKDNYQFFGIGSIVYSILYILLLYRNPYAITFPIFIAFTLLFCILALRKFQIPFKQKSYFYIVSSMLMSISVCLTANESIIIINKLGVVILIFYFMIEQIYDIKNWNVLNCMLKFLYRLCAIVPFAIKPFTHLKHFTTKNRRSSNSNFKYVMIGLFIAIPLTSIILVLLLHSDMIFLQLAKDFFSIFVVPEELPVLLFFLVLVYTLIYSFLCSSMVKKDRIIKQNIDYKPMIAITFTSILAVIYLIFSLIQIIYLFVGVPADVTYSEFARRGFFELLFVSSINLILVILCVELFQKNRILNIILTMISGCTYIMIASSAYRMLLYIVAYNLTFLRVMVLWFLVVLMILMSGVIFYIYKRRWSYFKFTLVIVSSMYLILIYSNPDRLISRYNVYHTSAEDKVFDIHYMNDLSMPDAVMELINDPQTLEKVSSLEKKRISEYCEFIVNYSEKVPIYKRNIAFWKAYDDAKKYLE